MTPGLSAAAHRLLDGVGALRLLVIGEACLDGWLSGPSSRLSREGPAPVVQVHDHLEVPGAGANAAVGAAALGARVVLLSVVGDDADGRRVRDLLLTAGVPAADVLADPGRATLAKRRILSDGSLLVRCDTGDSGPPSAGTRASLLARVRPLVRDCDAVLVADYGAGLFTPELVERVAAEVAAAGVLLVVDAHDPRRWAGAGADVVKPNAAELAVLVPAAAAAAGDPVPAGERVARLSAHAAEVLDAAGAPVVVATLDRAGAVVLQRGRAPFHVPARPAPESQAAGAGDTFAVALTLAMAAGVEVVPAAELAAAAAAVVVEQSGTAVCTAARLRERVSGRGPRQVDVGQLAPLASAHRALGLRIGFTNGCFDVLHRGHVAYLDSARRLCDVLVVGVNSDASVRLLKGPERPLNPVEDRLAVLSALSCVDHLVVFDGPTPADLLQALRPDIYVKGGDYTESMLAEAPMVRSLGGEVHIVDYVEDRSTTGLLDRIRRGG